MPSWQPLAMVDEDSGVGNIIVGGIGPLNQPMIAEL